MRRFLLALVFVLFLYSSAFAVLPDAESVGEEEMYFEQFVDEVYELLNIANTKRWLQNLRVEVLPLNLYGIRKIAERRLVLTKGSWMVTVMKQEREKKQDVSCAVVAIRIDDLKMYSFCGGLPLLVMIPEPGGYLLSVYADGDWKAEVKE
jgi:hypothetical protein